MDVRPTELRRSSVKLAFEMVCEADERLVAEGWGTLVGYDYSAGRAAPLPEAVAERLQRGGRRVDPVDELHPDVRRARSRSPSSGCGVSSSRPRPTVCARRDPIEAIHDARKRVKKTRALLRLARPALKPGVPRPQPGAARRRARAVRRARRRRDGRDGRRPRRALLRAAARARVRRGARAARRAGRREPSRSGERATRSHALADDEWPLETLDRDARRRRSSAPTCAGATASRRCRPRADGRTPARVAQAREGPLVPAAAARGDLAGRA